MEKSQDTNKSKNMILGFLPKAAVSLQNHIFSTRKDKRSDGTNSKKGKTHLNRGFSGPIRSGKSKNSKFDTQEPTSPKISCMGQIKHKKKLCKNKYVSLTKEFEPKNKLIGPPSELKKKPSMVLNIFSSSVKPERRKSDAATDHRKKPPLPDRAPSISQMKRFASCRDSHTLANFDWKTAQIAPEEQEYYSEGEEYDVIIPFSAPLLVAWSGSGSGGVLAEPRKEINLWQRRTLAQPKPLQLKMVSAAMRMISLVYMRVFLPESMMNKYMRSKDKENECLLEKAPTKKWHLFKTLPSLNDTLCLLRNSPTFAKVAIVAFFTNVADVGLMASLMYYLKAQFHHNKDQFADIMIISGVAGSISQLIIMPILTPLVGEEKLLSIGLFFNFVHIILYSIAWAPWVLSPVPYAAAMVSIVVIFAMPCLMSIASKQIGPREQGKAQGYVTGICSFANIISPLAFSPLAALFLSNNAPFHFPGFSIMCSGLAAMIAFIQSIMIRANPPVTTCAVENSDTLEP